MPCKLEKWWTFASCGLMTLFRFLIAEPHSFGSLILVVEKWKATLITCNDIRTAWSKRSRTFLVTDHRSELPRHAVGQSRDAESILWALSSLKLLVHDGLSTSDMRSEHIWLPVRIPVKRKYLTRICQYPWINQYLTFTALWIYQRVQFKQKNLFLKWNFDFCFEN